MRLSKALFIIGIGVSVVGIILFLVPTITERWEEKREELVNEVSKVWADHDHWPLVLPPLISEESSNIVVRGRVKELEGMRFDFYAFNKTNYDLWKAGAEYEAYDEAREVATHSFSFSPTREDVGKLRLVVSNVHATESRRETLLEATVRVPPLFHSSSSPPVLPTLLETEITIDGNAKEINNHEFNFYVLDSKNYDLWNTGQTYTSFYKEKRKKSHDFSFTVPKQLSTKSLYFVVERAKPDTELFVNISATKTWTEHIKIEVEYDVEISWKEKTYTHVIGGTILAIILASIGLMIIIISAAARFVFKM